MNRKTKGKNKQSKIYSQPIPIYIKILGSELSETFMPGMKKKIGCDREGSDKTRDNMTAARFEYCKPVYICSSLRK